MITKQQLKSILGFAAVFGVVGAFGVFAPAVSKAQAAMVTPCDFTGNLEVGVVNEEVRCLQKYLNSNGFKIADVGVGSPGSETAMYGSLTEEAVKRWQSSRGVSSTGIFGPLSKEEYLKHVAALLNSQLSNMGSGSSVTPPVPSTTITPAVRVEEESQEETEAREKIQEARDELENTEEDVDDADEGDIDIDDANDEIADAKDDLLEALYSFLDEDYSDAINKAEDVIDAMGDISDELHGDDNDAEEAIQDAEDAINEADDEIDAAYEDGDDVDEARDLLNDAEDKFDDAQDAFDDEDFDEAKDLAEEAEDLANDAIDAL